MQNIRPRRRRQNSSIRDLVRESSFSKNDIIAPIFVTNENNKKTEISSMPGIYRYSKELMLEHVSQLVEKGIKCISLFPAVDDSLKNRLATYSYNEENFYLKSISEIKCNFKDVLVMSDVAMDPYSSDGHDGIVNEKTGVIENDSTIEILSKMALAQAQAGSDIVGPSDMMDGRVFAIRKMLEENKLSDTLIMSYTAKYASAFYGPFRDALDSAPKSGDKKTYQMDFANIKEALIEAKLDEQEGADILMVKPGLPYLDVIKELSTNTDLPVAAYNVSGEYAMILAAYQNGWLDKLSCVHEMLTSFKRAGASMVLTYFYNEALELLD